MDCLVLDVGNEAEPPYHQLLEVVQDRLVHIDHPAASLADEVVMVTHFDVVVAESSQGRQGLSHHPLALSDTHNFCTPWCSPRRLFQECTAVAVGPSPDGSL